jgi:hypothetical protein
LRGKPPLTTLLKGGFLKYDFLKNISDYDKREIPNWKIHLIFTPNITYALPLEKYQWYIEFAIFVLKF